MSLNVTLPDTFSGPLDLLLHLIRRDEMDIMDISIAQLTASYLDELQRLEIIDVDKGAEFLDLASRLLEIKSRMLIPPEERLDEDEEEDEGFDPRTGLVEALLEYRRFKDAAKMLGDMAEEQSHRYPRVAPKMDIALDDTGASAFDCLDLLGAFQNLIIRMRPEDDANVITYTEIPTSVRIEQIETVVRETGMTRFSLLLSGKPNRREMVGFFIAMLELIRQGKLTARQSANFSDIILEPRARPSGAQTNRQPIRRRLTPIRFFVPATPGHKTAHPKNNRRNRAFSTAQANTACRSALNRNRRDKTTRHSGRRSVCTTLFPTIKSCRKRR